MKRLRCPLDCLLKPANNVCVWLNGALESERPVWTTLWNACKKRYCTDGGANRVVGRKNLKSPDVVIGDMDSILPAVEDSLKLTTLVIHAPDQDKTDLTKCLEVVAQNFKNGLELGYLLF
ncbi:hypothetical protein KIN20_006123 [Parelaphostrongylus tenuis]|uniref:Thiamin pyrophosphokinase catalytic domain-containing protein n=1 Tax=Parelaphostrongylus tenuis TaxID=148309 RepID=A0AAD5QI22_PARTN|nr:hypothetical protein KIN20_006123 [Parelaphostrongylus tenuis]